MANQIVDAKILELAASVADMAKSLRSIAEDVARLKAIAFAQLTPEQVKAMPVPKK